VLLFTIQSYIGFSNEFEPEAAATTLWVTGAPALVMIAIAAVLAWRRNRATA